MIDTMEIDAPESVSPAVDPADAPYGVRKDGEAARKPGRPAGVRNGQGRGRRPTSAPPPPARPAGPARPAAPRKPKSGDPDYTAGIKGMVQLACVPLIPLAQRDKRFAADVATITLYGDELAQQWNDAAKILPEFAAILDKVMTIGPWSLVLAPVVSIGLQISTNHGMLPAGTMGTLTVEEILARVSAPGLPA